MFVGGVWVGFLLGYSRAMREAAAKLQAGDTPVSPRFFFIIGGLSFLVGVVWTLYDWQFVSTATRAQGTIIGLRRSNYSDGEGEVVTHLCIH